MEFDQQPTGETWDLSSSMYLELNTQSLQVIQRIMQHLNLGVFTHKDLIWTIDFKFGVHKMETTYIPSHQL
jgi:hypothetical protein